jgi:hypothetical protein
MRWFKALLLAGLGLGLAQSAWALDVAKPKLGADAIPLAADTAYFRGAPAPDFWRLAQFYVPQDTSSACSVASLAMAVNFARGVPPGSKDALVTQGSLLEAVGDQGWVEQAAEDGAGVTFDELAAHAKASLAAYALASWRVEPVRFADDGEESAQKLREALAANEASDADMLLVYFNQGVLTGDWDGPHISPIGAYDAQNDRVLIMDVDREWYVPYWSPVPKLLEAMLRPAPADQGVLAGETGGLVWVRSGN